MQNFLEFLSSSARLTDENYLPSSPLEHAIHADRDRLLAWREHAPSRQIITFSQGPFTSDRIRTRGGIFSALIFRAITFGAPVLHDHHGYFPDLLSWNTFYDNTRPRSYYCNTRIYGNTVDRGVHHVPRLWLASETLLAMLTADQMPSFQTVWEHLRDGRVSDGRILYPTIGALIGYLLCVDLVYAGMLAMPSVEDMGFIVAQIGKGGRDGLIKLQLVRPSASRQEVSLAFQSLFHYLQQNSTTAFHSLHFNVFIVEHGLCKYKRLGDLTD